MSVKSANNSDVVAEVAEAADIETASMRSPSGQDKSDTSKVPRWLVGGCSIHY